MVPQYFINCYVSVVLSKCLFFTIFSIVKLICLCQRVKVMTFTVLWVISIQLIPSISFEIGYCLIVDFHISFVPSILIYQVIRILQTVGSVWAAVTIFPRQEGKCNSTHRADKECMSEVAFCLDDFTEQPPVGETRQRRLSSMQCYNYITLRWARLIISFPPNNT